MGTGPLVGPCSGRVDKRWNQTSRVSPRVCVLRASILSPAWNSPTPPKFSLSLSVPAQEYLNSPFVANATLFFLPFLRNQQSQAPRFSRAHAFLRLLRRVRNDLMSAELAGTASLRVHISARSILLLLGKAVRHPVKSSTRDHSIHGRSTTNAMAINEVSFNSPFLPLTLSPFAQFLASAFG